MTSTADDFFPSDLATLSGYRALLRMGELRSNCANTARAYAYEWYRLQAVRYIGGSTPAMFAMLKVRLAAFAQLAPIAAYVRNEVWAKCAKAANREELEAILRPHLSLTEKALMMRERMLGAFDVERDETTVREFEQDLRLQGLLERFGKARAIEILVGSLPNTP